MKVIPIIMICSLLSGCFIALPSGGNEYTEPFHDKTIVLDEPISIVTMYLYDDARKHPVKQLGKNQEILLTIDAKEEIRVLGSKSRREPTGVSWSLYCKYPKTGKKFTLRERLAKELNIKIVEPVD
jgi:hypothetical protein